MKNKMPVVVLFIIIAILGFGLYAAYDRFFKPNTTLHNESEYEATANPNAAEEVESLGEFQGTGTEAAGDIYYDPNRRYQITPPENWKLMKSKRIIEAGKEQLPENLKSWVQPDKVDAMFMNLTDTDEVGNNLNIIILKERSLIFSEQVFELFKDTVEKQYKSMNLKNYKLVKAERINFSGRTCAYFEIALEMMNLDMYITQLLIPGKRNATLLTYTIVRKSLNDEMRNKIQKSINSFVPNEKMGY